VYQPNYARQKIAYNVLVVTHTLYKVQQHRNTPQDEQNIDVKRHGYVRCIELFHLIKIYHFQDKCLAVRGLCQCDISRVQIAMCDILHVHSFGAFTKRDQGFMEVAQCTVGVDVYLALAVM